MCLDLIPLEIPAVEQRLVGVIRLDLAVRFLADLALANALLATHPLADSSEYIINNTSEGSASRESCESGLAPTCRAECANGDGFAWDVLLVADLGVPQSPKRNPHNFEPERVQSPPMLRNALWRPGTSLPKS